MKSSQSYWTQNDLQCFETLNAACILYINQSLLSFWTHRVCGVFERPKIVILDGFKLLEKTRN